MTDGRLHRGLEMKAIAFVLLVALVVAFGIAIPAYATRVGNYITWSTTGTNAGTGGPHQNYQLATAKCAVCHSVHQAALSNAATDTFGPYPTGPDETEMLLRSSVAKSCEYCHVQTNLAGLQIYGGVVSNYELDDIYGHNGSIEAECSDCHSVHGADVFGGSIGSKVLKRGGAPANTPGNVQLEANAYYAGLLGGSVYTTAGNRNAQVSALCTRCHKVFSGASETTITADMGAGMQGAKNHPLKTADAAFVAKGQSYFGRVAWLDSQYCRSCHGAGLTEQSAASGGPGGLVLASFPHYTPLRARFLTAGWGSQDTSATPWGPGNAVSYPSQDGVCLRCHTNASASGNATGGVGVTF